MVIAGAVMLISAIVMGFTLGTIAVPVTFLSSVLVNSIGVMLIRHKGDKQ